MEIWKDIEGFEGCYQVSNLGRVKSIGRIVVKKEGDNQNVKEKILKNSNNGFGYTKIIVNLFGNPKTFLIHRLVAKAFIPNPENKPEVNHINGIKTDNRVENLEWVTKSENSKHAHKIGLKNHKGENSPFSRLTNEIVRKIKYEHKELNQFQLAEMYNIHQSTVSYIRSGKRWGHI